MIKDEADAFERDQAVGELVLDRLEPCDRLPELVTLLGVVHGQIERPPGRAMRPPQQGYLGLEADIVEVSAFKRKQCQRHGIQPHLAEPPGAHGARRHEENARNIQLNQSKAGCIDGHQKMCGAGRFDEAKYTRCVPTIDADRAGA